MNFILGNAAHAYGMDDVTANGPEVSFGAQLYANYSIDPNNLDIGQTLITVAGFANNIVLKTSITRTGAETLNINDYNVSRASDGQLIYDYNGTVPVDLSLNGNPFVQGLNGADNITCNDFNNVLEGYGGNDRLDGGGGTDTAVYRGTKVFYTITRVDANTLQVSGGTDGADTLINVERLKFTDVTVAYDTAGTAGQAYRMYQAALGRAPDTYGLGAQVRALDAGTSLKQLAANFMASGEFRGKYGSLGNLDFTMQLYANVLHRSPDAAGLVAWVANLDHGTMDRADVLMGFSESAENQAALIGVMANGMSFAN